MKTKFVDARAFRNYWTDIQKHRPQRMMITTDDHGNVYLTDTFHIARFAGWVWKEAIEKILGPAPEAGKTINGAGEIVERDVLACYDAFTAPEEHSSMILTPYTRHKDHDVLTMMAMEDGCSFYNEKFLTMYPLLPRAWTRCRMKSHNEDGSPLYAANCVTGTGVTLVVLPVRRNATPAEIALMAEFRDSI